jgi:hypothetical protein
MTDPGKSEVLQGTLDLMILKNAAGVGAATWLWDCPAHRAGQPRCTAIERRYGVHAAVAAAAAEVDRCGVGNLRQ